ncbi:MAG: 16S rRNA (cytidine(1402)-2'-O)-methyltransferase [Frankiaceae bacterium]
MTDAAGRLVIAATPIGNVADASPRLAAELASADIVAAEDTRRMRRLAGALGVQVAGRVVSYYDANESVRTGELLSAALGGARVLLVTDAGSPSVSDPGYRLVTAAIEAGVPVSMLPGPSAVTTALVISGLPCDRWCFEGFLPRRGGERRTRLATLADEPRTLVFFEAPHRLAAALVDLAGAFGADRRAAVCRELTKTYEEVRRGPLGELAEWASGGVRGEVTLVVAGASTEAAGSVEPADLAAAVAAREAAGTARTAAIAEVATASGMPKRSVYEAVVAAKFSAPGNRPGAP